MEGGGGESILESIFDEQTLEQDVDMLDAETVEDGEIKDLNPPIHVHTKDVVLPDQPLNKKNSGRRTKKKRNKNKNKNKNGSDQTITDINRFVIDTCRRLKEKKSYLIWNAVGVLGVSVVSELVKEVDAIQTCGGQMTADGKRARFPGGILWNILKRREPKAYKEIMAKGKEFEKQFQKQNTKQRPISRERIACASTDQSVDAVGDCFNSASQVQGEAEQVNAHTERTSALNRIRVPVTYDDLFGDDNKNESLSGFEKMEDPEYIEAN